jgi:simple sugar transport system ATP-binding protein
VRDASAAGTSSPAAAPIPAVELVGLRKRFGATVAVAGIDLALGHGEIHGLVGANGAGKSTLIRMLSGATRPDEGHVRIDGREMPLGDPALSRAAGIQAVYQEIDAGILPGHTVAENLAIDRLGDPSTGIRYRTTEMHAAAERIAAALDLELPLDAPIERVGASDRQRILICRALARDPRLLILDEPTSALSQREAELLFRHVRELAERGVTVLYISHRLGEVAGLVHRVSVLRNGRLVRTMEPPFSPALIGQAMLGHEPTSGLAQRREPGDPVLTLEGVRTRATRPAIDLVVRTREAVGIFGLLGAGKSALLEGLFGARPIAEGRVTIDGRHYRPVDPAGAVLRGVHLVPEERSVQAVFRTWSVSQNVTIPFLSGIERLGLLDGRLERARGALAMRTMRIAAAGPDAPLRTLSGGNQQKVVVARWFVERARVLLFDEPFRGIDLGARADISAAIREAATERAVLVASADIDELLDVADRIVVLHDGSIVHDGPAGSVSREAYAALAAGGAMDLGSAA